MITRLGLCLFRVSERCDGLARNSLRLPCSGRQLAAGTDRLTLDEINAEMDAVREARTESGRRTMNLYRETETPDDT